MDSLKPLICGGCEFFIADRQLCRRHPAFVSKRKAEAACGEFAGNQNQSGTIRAMTEIKPKEIKSHDHSDQRG